MTKGREGKIEIKVVLLLAMIYQVCLVLKRCWQNKNHSQEHLLAFWDTGSLRSGQRST